MSPLIIVAVIIGLGLIVAAVAMGNGRPKSFRDDDNDGEPDETPAQKRRAREELDD